MTIIENKTLAIIILLMVQDARPQGTFQNLDFEAADIPPSTSVPSLVPVSEGLPGWSAFYGSIQATEVSYDGISLGGVTVSIIDDKAPSFAPLQGTYSAFLFGGAQGSGSASAGISQTGLVPAGTQSLQFDAYVSGAPFVVTLGGQTINMTPLQTFAHYTLWGGNIPSSLDAQSEALTFTEPPPPSGAMTPSMFELDDIVFSPTSVIPEPSPLALVGIGTVLFALYRRFTVKRQ